jgi:hypothetical protein
MEPSQSQVPCEPLLAAMPQLKEKPCLGVRSSDPALHPGQFVCNSRTAIGLQFGWSGIVSGPVVAPSNGQTTPQNKQQLKQACDAIYNNYVGNVARQKIKNSLTNVVFFVAGLTGGPWAASAAGGASLANEYLNNWNMDPINLQAALQLQNAGCFNQGIGY